MILNPPFQVLGKKIALSTLYQYAGRAVQLVFAAISLKLIASFLSQTDYGLYGAISEYALFFSVVANLGIFANVVKKMADDPLNGKIFVNALILRIFTAGIFFIGALVFFLFQHGNGIFILSTALFLAALLCDFVSSVCDGMLQANYWMGRATLALIAGKAITLVGVVIIIKFKLEVGLAMPMLFGMTLVGSLITMAISFLLVRQKIKLEWKIDRAFLWDIFKISLPFGVITFLNNLYFRFLPDYFSHEVLNGAQFAAFNIAFRASQVISLLSTFLMFSALPGFKQYIDQKHWQKARHLYRRLWLMLAVSGVVVVVIGSLLGPSIIALLTHKKFFVAELWFILPLMLLLAAISYGYDLMLISLFALEQDRWFMKMEVVALAIALVFFGSSWFVKGLEVKILLIIMGAIAGELTMVILGNLKLHQILTIKTQVPIKA